ncbi:membrane-associated protein, putative, partial [Bodo saltans]
ASLQRSASVLRLASWCDASRTLNADSNEQLFTDVSDNPLGLSLPVQSVPLATAAGAAVGNALLVLVIGIAQHGLHVVQHHTAVMVLPLPLRSFIEQFPSSMLPGSLSGSYGSFMQPSLEACLVLLVSSQKSTAAWACGAVMVFVWIVFSAYCMYVILFAGRHRGTFVLKGVRCDHAILHLSLRNHTSLRSRSKQYFHLLSHIRTYLMNATSKWDVRPATTGNAAQRRETQRIAPKQLLERMEGVFEGYEDRREWFFMVPWGLSILGGVVLGALTAMASDDASAACRASLWAAGVALVLGVAEVVLCVLLCPFTVRLELVATVTGLSLGVVGNALVLGGEDDVAGGVVSAAEKKKCLASRK